MLINNAGILTYGYFHETPADRLYRLVQVNLLAPMHLSSLFLQNMVRRRNGHLVFLCSVSGFVPTTFETPYSVSKFGIRGLGMCLEGELSRLGVAVTNVYPFWSNTGMLKSPSYGTKKAVRPPRFLIVQPERVVKNALRGIGRKKLHVYADAYSRVAWWLTKFWPLRGKQPVR